MRIRHVMVVRTDSRDRLHTRPLTFARHCSQSLNTSLWRPHCITLSPVSYCTSYSLSCINKYSALIWLQLINSPWNDWIWPLKHYPKHYFGTIRVFFIRSRRIYLKSSTTSITSSTRVSELETPRAAYVISDRKPYGSNIFFFRQQTSAEKYFLFYSLFSFIYGGYGLTYVSRIIVQVRGRNAFL
jgi:hypothetical protein